MYSASRGPELPARKSACGLDALSSPRRRAWPRSALVQDTPVCLWMVHVELTCIHVHTYVPALRAFSRAWMFYPTTEITGNALTIEYGARSLGNLRILRHKDYRREYTTLNIQEFKIPRVSKIQLIYEFAIIRQYRKYISWPTSKKISQAIFLRKWLGTKFVFCSLCHKSGIGCSLGR